MKERPILFSAPMVRAILDGSKTQTRRMVKDEAKARAKNANGFIACPYGQPGDRLWVRETFCDARKALMARVLYRADGDTACRWHPSIHMPRDCSRITLEVTGARVERLNDISRGDAAAEGVQSFSDQDAEEFAKRHVEWLERKLYRELWESINGPGSWALNPWVWVVEFKRITPA